MERRVSDVESMPIDPIPRRIYTIGGDIDAKPLRVRFDVIAKKVRMNANRIDTNPLESRRFDPCAERYGININRFTSM